MFAAEQIDKLVLQINLITGGEQQDRPAGG